MAYDEELLFTSFAQLATHLRTLKGRVPAAARAALEDAGENILARTQEKFGRYQGAVGPFEAWKKLMPSTLERRRQRGINPDDEPLYESGDLASSYQVALDKASGMVAIGSEEEKAVVQETGDPRRGIPPRAALGPAVYQYEKEHEDIFDETFIEILLHGRRFRRLRTRSAPLRRSTRSVYGNTELDTGNYEEEEE